jgi:type IV pilus assembly protein PilB
MRAPSKEQLIQALVEAHVASRKELKALERREKAEGRSFEELLLLEAVITADRLAEIKSKIANVPTADLAGFIDPAAAALVPEDAVRRMGILPLRREGKRLIVAMADPWDLEALEFLKKKSGAEVVVQQYAPREAIAGAFERVKTLGMEMGLMMEGRESADEESRVVHIVDTLIQNAIRLHASDVHIEPQENELAVRYRIDGILRDIVTFPKERAPAIIARIKVLAALKLDEHRLPQDGRFMMRVNGRRFSFRTSVMPVFDGEKAALRILEEEARAFTLEELGFTAVQQERVRRAIGLPFGMILATGPTGSGKTTTLYTLLRMLNKREVNIVTAEDPVEYRLEGVNQTQVRPEIGLTFANALRSLLRQDPNIIMVGEIRDVETADLAVNAALTGHLVLSTLHTNDAPGALPRLLEMGVQGFLIASTVRLIIAQRLVRRLCEDGKAPYRLSEGEYRELKKSVDVPGIEEVLRKEGILASGQTMMDATWYRPGPSADCPDGYRGRIAVAEVLEVTESIRQLIFSGANADEIRDAARAEGMHTIQETGFLAAARGITSIEEVLRTAKE